MDTDQQNQDDVQDLILDNSQESENQQEHQKKSKEENFDGVVRKLNAKEKELKTVISQRDELQAKIESQSTDATKSQEDLLAKMQSEIEELKNERQKEVFQSKLEKGLDQANIEPKFNKLAKTALQDIAHENSLDLSNPSELSEAIKLLTTDYPEFVSKKPKQIGIANGQTAGTNSNLSVLDGNAEAYFKLSDAEKAALNNKILGKK